MRQALCTCASAACVTKYIKRSAGNYRISLSGRVNGDGECFIGVSLSCDGVRWTQLHALINSTCTRGRTHDQPVHGLLYDGETVSFYVHRDVPQISPAAPTRSRLVRYYFSPPALARFTATSKARLSGCLKVDQDSQTSRVDQNRKVVAHLPSSLWCARLG